MNHSFGRAWSALKILCTILLFVLAMVTGGMALAVLLVKAFTFFGIPFMLFIIAISACYITIYTRMTE